MSKRKSAVVDELHRPARSNCKRRHVDVRRLDETWQADLVDMSAYARHNNGYKYLLTVIDVFLKFAWAVLAKTKSAKDVTAAMQFVLAQGRTPTHLHTDAGREFYNAEFKALMRKYGINLYSTFSNLNASICERFNRTLKNKMWKRLTLRGNYKWIDILSDLVSSYNDSKYRTIKMKPKDVTDVNEKKLLRRVYKHHHVHQARKNKFKVGDKARISKYKHVFEKGYISNWTTEIFTISEVKDTDLVTYKLTTIRVNRSMVVFTRKNLSVRYPDIYLIQKVLRRRENKLYIKWLGFDNSHNSWINKSDL